MKKFLLYAILCSFCHMNVYCVEETNHVKNLLIVTIHQFERESVFGDKVDEEKIRENLLRLESRNL